MNQTKEELKKTVLITITELSDDLEFMDKINKVTYAYIKNGK